MTPLIVSLGGVIFRGKKDITVAPPGASISYGVVCDFPFFRPLMASFDLRESPHSCQYCAAKKG